MSDEKVREMTVEEKEKFLNRVRIEMEDIPETPEPEDIFKTTIKTYDDSMLQQISKLESAIALNQYMKEKVVALMENTEGLPDGIDEESIKTEISARDSVLAKMTESKLIMQHRLALSKEVSDFVLSNYEKILALDFYFGGVIGLDETRNKMENILKYANDIN